MHKQVHVIGRGKVGTAIVDSLLAKEVRVSSSPLRNGLPDRIDAEIAVFAVRDSVLAESIVEAGQKRLFSSSTVVLHVAGAFGLEVLAPLRGTVRGVGCLHPMIAFAGKKAPSLKGGHALVDGDRKGLEEARRLAEWLGLCARRFPRIDREAYHTAAALLAGGGVALAHAARQLLVASGVPEEMTGKILGPLLRSVAENIAEYGTTMAMTGPIRRGDTQVVRCHAEALRKAGASILPTWRGLSMVQVSIAETIGEASKENLEAIAELVQQTQTEPLTLPNRSRANEVAS